MFGSNCCFLTCIQISQEAGQVVWYSHLFQNFPQFVVIHTVKGFDIVNKAEVDGLSFLMIQQMLVIWSLVPLPFLNPAWTSGSSWFMYCWSLAWRILSITLLACDKLAQNFKQKHLLSRAVSLGQELRSTLDSDSGLQSLRMCGLSAGGVTVIQRLHQDRKAAFQGGSETCLASEHWLVLAT